MAYTRKIYDENAYNKELQESTEPGRYSLLSDSTYNYQTCFQETPEIHSNLGQYRISEQNDMINAESDLFNLIRKDSKDPKQQYPYIKPEYKKQPKIDSCKSTDLSRQYPLLEAPAFKREQQIHVNRFESLCLNPQDMSRIRANSYIGLNSRLFFRDNHKTKNPVLNNNVEKVLPNGGDFNSPMNDFLSYADFLQKKEEPKKEKKEESKKENEKKEKFTVGDCSACSL